MCEEDVCQVFLKQKSRKAPSPDSASHSCLRTCAHQLAPVFTQIFNNEVLSCFKYSTIIPDPHLKDITSPLIDPLQFSYWANRSVDDAVNMGLHYILRHLDHTGTYARIFFADFSLVFSTSQISSRLNWSSSLCPTPTVSGSPDSW